VRLDHLLSKEHLTAAPRGVGVYAVFVSVRLTHGTLISGALANRMTGVRSGRWYRLNPLAGDGSGKTVSGSSGGFGHTVGS
jgi:hypothetical protein